MNTNNRINRISCVAQADGSIDIVVPASMAEDFKLLVRRGTNTYPSQHVEIRDFADRLLRPGLDSSCMKEELFGYPLYARPLQTDEKEEEVLVTANPEGFVADSNGIISTHWDIPSEDKYALAKKD